ncbi:MAG TPA: hypothetical protein VGG25_21755 [Streptosporangiaceae bacterium]
MDQTFCTGCGAQLRPPAAQPATLPPATPPPGDLPPRRRAGPIVIAAVLVLVLVLGGGAVAWTLIGHGHARHTAGPGASGRPARSQPAEASSPASSGSPASSAAASTPASSQPAASLSTQATAPGAVTIGPDAGQETDAQQVAAFLSTYFQAINSRDYGTYLSLMEPGLRPTYAQFESGYRSTHDSGAVLTDLTGAGAGLAASVSFTSHQRPGESPTGTACTSWDITLYLVSRHGGFQIVHPPPGYHARDFAC